MFSCSMRKLQWHLYNSGFARSFINSREFDEHKYCSTNEIFNLLFCWLATWLNHKHLYITLGVFFEYQVLGKTSLTSLKEGLPPSLIKTPVGKQVASCWYFHQHKLLFTVSRPLCHRYSTRTLMYYPVCLVKDGQLFRKLSSIQDYNADILVFHHLHH